jgi:myo-inositol catabolism protein IolC
MRPGLMVRAIEDFHRHGIEPTIWKIEGLDSGPLREWRQNIATREQAVQQIAGRYGLWTRTFIAAQAAA